MQIGKSNGESITIARIVNIKSKSLFRELGYIYSLIIISSNIHFFDFGLGSSS